MSNSDGASVNAVLETVTRTLRGMVDLVDEAVKAVKLHTRMFSNVEHNMAGMDAKIRTAESKIYALEQDKDELRRELEALELRHTGVAAAFNAHYHSRLHGDA